METPGIANPHEEKGSEAKGANPCPNGAGAADEACNPREKEGPAVRKTRKRRANRKIALASAVAAAVLVALGVGLALWHEQPSFCNAICHVPMDPYVEGYSEGSGMARIHAEADVSCLDCHETTFGEQVQEGIAWVSGDFREKPDMMTDYDNETCLKCHISEEYQAAKTDLLEKNPHSDAHQELKCTDCHKSHREQVNYCSNCHDAGGQRMITYPLDGHASQVGE